MSIFIHFFVELTRLSVCCERRGVRMTDVRDRLDNLIARNGDQWLLDLIDIKFPETEEVFVDRINREIDSIVDELESSARFTFKELEEELSNRVIALLRRAGYRADAETDNRGHVDIMVRSSQRWTWLAECKIHGSYEEMREGLRQLLTRYTTGRSPYGSFLIFIKNKKGGDVVENWRKKLRDEEIEAFKADIDDEQRFCFLSLHAHATTGTDYHVRHVGVMLYYSPQDRSALASLEMGSG